MITITVDYGTTKHVYYFYAHNLREKKAAWIDALKAVQQLADDMEMWDMSKPIPLTVIEYRSEDEV